MMDTLINRDWLSFSVLLAMGDEECATGARLSCPDGFALVECSGTNIYKRRVMVMNVGGEKMLTLLLEPYSAQILDKRSMFVEVANKWLYGSLDWVMPLLERIHLFSFQSLSRIDICCDFVPTLAQMQVIEGLQSNELYVAGKREGSMFHDYHIPVDGGQLVRAAKCISWGSKQSNIRWKLYNKSLEIYEIDTKGKRWCTKPYIEEQWKVCGFDCDNVWRLEFSIMGAAKYSWHGEKLGWSNIIDRDKVLSLWNDMYATRFVIRYNQGHKSRKWDDRADFLPLESKEPYRIRQRLVGKEQYHTDHAATMRAAMAQLARPEVKTYPALRGVWLDALESTISMGHLEGYFRRSTGFTFKEWRDCYLADSQIVWM